MAAGAAWGDEELSGLLQAEAGCEAPSGTCSLKSQAHACPAPISGQRRAVEEETGIGLLQLKLFANPGLKPRAVTLVRPTS